MIEVIRIYVVDLAAYNNGRLHGVWINACDEIEDIQKQINTMLTNSPEEFAEEYAIHDYKGFEGYNVSEYEGIQSVHDIACFIDEHPGIGGELVNHYDDLEEARTAMEENYSGRYPSLADFAQELAESQVTEIPDNISWYIDYERMGRDMELGGDIFTIQTAHDEVHVFWSQ